MALGPSLVVPGVLSVIQYMLPEANEWFRPARLAWRRFNLSSAALIQPPLHSSYGNTSDPASSLLAYPSPSRNAESRGNSHAAGLTPYSKPLQIHGRIHQPLTGLFSPQGQVKPRTKWGTARVLHLCQKGWFLTHSLQNPRTTDLLS